MIRWLIYLKVADIPAFIWFSQWFFCCGGVFIGHSGEPLLNLRTVKIYRFATKYLSGDHFVTRYSVLLKLWNEYWIHWFELHLQQLFEKKHPSVSNYTWPGVVLFIIVNLRVQALSITTDGIYHVYCNFSPGFTGQTITVIFGIMRNRRLLIHSLASFHCFIWKTKERKSSFKMAPTIYQKRLNTHTPTHPTHPNQTQSSKFRVVWTIQFGLNVTSMWIKILRNEWMEKLPMLTLKLKQLLHLKTTILKITVVRYV